MADMDLVQIVRKCRDAVASWREEHPGETMDLYNSYMSHVRIPMVDLSGCDLRESDFMGAMLRRANLSGCYLNPVHMYRADLREADLSKTLMNRANLRGADLRQANLEGADMDSAILSDANLTGASLKGANLSRVNLDRANLSDADLTDAIFHGAALTRADLSGANLAGCPENPLPSGTRRATSRRNAGGSQSPGCWGRHGGFGLNLRPGSSRSFERPYSPPDCRRTWFPQWGCH